MIADASIQNIPNCRDAIAVSGNDAARLLGLSGRTWRRLDAQGLVPRAVRIGQSKRWSIEDLRQWVAAECPARARWESTKKVAATGHGRRRRQNGHQNDCTHRKLPVSNVRL